MLTMFLKHIDKAFKETFPQENKKIREFYNFVELEFKIKAGKLIDQSSKSILENYPDIINDLLAEKGVLCTLVSYFYRINKKMDSSIPKVVFYMNCMHVHCKTYKLCLMDIEDDPIHVKLYSRGEFNEAFHRNPNIKVTRPLSKEKRVEVGKELMHESPSTVRMKADQTVKNDSLATKRLAFGSLGPIKSADVYKKLKQEVSEAADLAKDDMVDLLLHQMANKSWFHSFSSPMRCIVLSDDQINALLNLRPQTLLLDATGSLMRIPSNFPLVYTNI